MKVIYARGVNDALMQFQDAVAHERETDTRTVSPRGHQTFEFPMPVATVYSNPRERVLFNKLRDANPFFHLMEAMWMLAGRDDVAFVAEFNSQIAQFSDDGLVLTGSAYGRKWHNTGGRERTQIGEVVRVLRDDPDSRRAVVSMWSPLDYSTKETKDLPCNTHIYFKIRGGALNMTVCCRSNDALLGCYGSNMVHFSILQEYIAAQLGVLLGHYIQFSDSLHVYLDSPVWQRMEKGLVERHNPYHEVRPTSLIASEEGVFQRSLEQFFESHPSWWAAHKDRWGMIRDPFIRGTVLPMVYVWYRHKNKGVTSTALEWIHANDWRRACTEWIERRQPKQEEMNLGYA